MKGKGFVFLCYGCNTILFRIVRKNERFNRYLKGEKTVTTRPILPPPSTPPPPPPPPPPHTLHTKYSHTFKLLSLLKTVIPLQFLGPRREL